MLYYKTAMYCLYAHKHARTLLILMIHALFLLLIVMLCYVSSLVDIYLYGIYKLSELLCFSLSFSLRIKIRMYDCITLQCTAHTLFFVQKIDDFFLFSLQFAVRWVLGCMHIKSHRKYWYWELNQRFNAQNFSHSALSYVIYFVSVHRQSR